MTNRLNPITTPRHELRAEKARRNRETALNAFIGKIVAALDWKAHTARGAMSGALKKKLGLTITSEKIEGRGRAYRITDN